jgi:hypothetical protein
VTLQHLRRKKESKERQEVVIIIRHARSPEVRMARVRGAAKALLAGAPLFIADNFFCERSVLEHDHCNCANMAGPSDKARFYLEQSATELNELERKNIFTRVKFGRPRRNSTSLTRARKRSAP